MKLLSGTGENNEKGLIVISLYSGIRRLGSSLNVKNQLKLTLTFFTF